MPAPPAAAPAPAAARIVRASPVARKLAEERGIDLARLTGSGPGGRITKDDVLGAQPEPASPAVEPVPAAVAAGLVAFTNEPTGA
ncbi:MAG: E3 binding domain-containing protein [Bacteroidetes bacterium]|nr:E3 binding domain-containing protein [Bacteroidota bacterium]